MRATITPQHFGALSVPIYPASVFAFADADEASAIHNEEKPGYYYGRLGNPTQTALEAAMAELENGEAALALASGMAAISGVILSLVKSGDHIVAPASGYPTTQNLLRHIERFGIETTFVDALRCRGLPGGGQAKYPAFLGRVAVKSTVVRYRYCRGSGDRKGKWDKNGSR